MSSFAFGFYLILSFFFSFVFTYFLTPCCIFVAQKWRIIDTPDGDIKRHKRPTPYLGGVAVFLGFFLSLLATLPFFTSKIWFLVLGVGVLMILGLIDDLWRISPLQKFIGQFFIALVFLYAGMHLRYGLFSIFFTIPLSLFWVLLITNAFNLIDVMDGLATLVAALATLFFLAYSIFLCPIHLCIVLTSFLGALVAFFMYNKPPAKIYLGDAGSLAIGGFLACISFLIDWGACGDYGIFMPTIILGVPLLELIGLVCIRTLKGVPFYQGSPDHFSIYLQQAGWSPNNILLFTSGFSALLSIIAYMYMFNQLSFFSGIISLILLISSWVFTIWNNKLFL